MRCKLMRCTCFATDQTDGKTSTTGLQSQTNAESSQGAVFYIACHRPNRLVRFASSAVVSCAPALKEKGLQEAVMRSMC